MNFLAHLYLSSDHPGIMTGNFIGDFVKGRDLDARFGFYVARGIDLHRIIDEFTDKHPQVRNSRARLWDSYRHYARVIVDVYYDHFLARDWQKFHPVPLQQYAPQAYETLLTQEEILPDGVKQMLPYMMRGNWLLNYSQLEGIDRALTGMSRRTRFESNMEKAVHDLQRYYPEFEHEFGQFFPTLQEMTSRWLQENVKR
ncbi:MAG: acyl carrier protein phosphodiesterase [Cyclobacteriaceae bacterium]|nr:acyl carrier protein phosphodiesterase [Cyclobacteriaceae bacterium]